MSLCCCHRGYARSRNTRRSLRNRQNNLQWRSAETQLHRNRRIGAIAENLEDRVLLAAFIVNTATDVIDAGDGLTSLREAIIGSNASAEADTITFDASLNGTHRVDDHWVWRRRCGYG